MELKSESEVFHLTCHMSLSVCLSVFSFDYFRKEKIDNNFNNLNRNYLMLMLICLSVCVYD